MTYDIEKWRGVRSPLGQWFAENARLLRDAAALRKLPPQWHGLWVLDWRSGHLMGFADIPAPINENHVQLDDFIESIAAAENLGDGSCSFAEMIQRGRGALGYVCGGTMCSQDAKGADSAEKLLKQLAGQVASFGGRQAWSATASQSCKRNSAEGSRKGSGSAFCPQNQGTGLGGRAEQHVQCLTQQIVKPYGKALRCMAEATGMCSDPADRLSKQLRDSLYAGVKFTPGCSAEAEGAGSDDYKNDPQYRSEIDEIEKYYNDSISRIEAMKAITLKGIEDMLQQDLAKANDKPESQRKADYEKAINSSNQWTEGALKARDTALQAAQAQRQAEKDKAEKDAKDRAAKEKAAKEKAAKEKAAKEKAEKERKEKEAKAKAENKNNKGQPVCQPESGNCAPSACSAMAQAAMQTMKCVTAELDQAERDPFATKSGTCDPRVCDDMDATKPDMLAASKCLQSIDAAPSISIGRQCWAVQCGPGFVSGPMAGGGCGCRPEGAGGGDLGAMPDACAAVHCSEGEPRVVGMRCECGDEIPLTTSGPPGEIDITPLGIDGTSLDLQVLFGPGQLPPY